MSYLINSTTGQLLINIIDGTADGPDINPGLNTTDLDLFGKNYPLFGQYQNENFIKLLQNFANPNPPTKPLQGELWFNTNTGFLNVYNGTSWVLVSPVLVSNVAPASTSFGSIQGTQWWDTINYQLNSWNGSSWTLVGPGYSAVTGKSGAISETVMDTVGGSHIIIKFYSKNNVIAVSSYDPTFTLSPENPIPGFSSIGPGFTVAIGISNEVLFVGSATNAKSLGNVAAANYARTDIVPVFSSNIEVGGGNIIIDSAPTGTSRYYNTVLNGNISLHLNVGGVDTTAFRVNGADGSSQVNGNLLLNGNLIAYGVTSTGITGTQRLVLSNNPTLTGTLTAQTGVFGSLSTTGAFSVNTNMFTVTPATGDTVIAGNLSVNKHITIEGVTSAGATGTGDVVFNVGPALQGTPTSTTPPLGDISTSIATTAFVNTAIATSSLGLWQGSRQFVSSSSPSSGQGNVGDFWFQI